MQLTKLWLLLVNRALLPRKQLTQLRSKTPETLKWWRLKDR